MINRSIDEPSVAGFELFPRLLGDSVADKGPFGWTHTGIVCGVGVF